ASATAAGAASRRSAKAVSARAAATARADLGCSRTLAARPGAGPSRYLPLRMPPSRQNEATTLAPACARARVIAPSSTGDRLTRLYGSGAAHGAGTPAAAVAAAASLIRSADQFSTPQALAAPALIRAPTSATSSVTLMP